MTPEEKNNHYHNILAFLNKNETKQETAKAITLYLEYAVNQKELDIEERKELYGGTGSPDLPPPKFGKTFKRII